MLVLVLPNGAIIRDPDWHTLADVMGSFHAFGVNRVYGQLQTDDGTPLTHMIPFPQVDGPYV